MSGLLALLDDVAAIAKVAAASIDDVAGMTAKAGAKVSGVVIDDAAVTPAYVSGFSADRELPIIWKIARGSIFNKLVILLPVALLLKSFAPWAIAPLLMVGGAYLCFEGAEKVLHWLRPVDSNHDGTDDLQDGDPSHLEEARVKGAIKTDFILSAEIMTIALASLPEGQGVWLEAAVLVAVAVGITALVYGGVALIVKMDDIGLALTRRGAAAAAMGRAILRAMPIVMRGLTIIGTAAMIWVGGNIVVHGLHELGAHEPYATISHLADRAAAALPQAAGLVAWSVTALLDGVIGLLLGLALIPLSSRVIGPLVAMFGGQRGRH